MKYLKYYNFDKYANDIKSIVDRESDIYNKDVETQFSIDLFYGLKWVIIEYLQYNEINFDNYKNRMYREIEGIVHKYSKYKFYILNDLSLVKEIMWEHINDELPYNEIKHSPQLQNHIFDTVNNIIQDLKNKKLLKV